MEVLQSPEVLPMEQMLSSLLLLCLPLPPLPQMVVLQTPQVFPMEQVVTWLSSSSLSPSMYKYHNTKQSHLNNY